MEYETPQFFRVMQYASAAERDVVDMVSGSPDWDPPESIRTGLAEYAQANASEFQYPPSVGLDALREEIAARRGLQRKRVMITNGAGEANHLAMTEGLATFSGSRILLVDPVYPYYAGRASMLAAEVDYVAADDAGYVDPEAVRERASEATSVIVINSPNNPLGVTYGRKRKRELAGIAEEHDALLVCDEVYDHFDYSGRFESALAIDSPNVVVTNAFSKSLAITGWRVGYAVFPDPAEQGDLLSNARTRHMLTNVTCSRPPQAAVLYALSNTSPTYYERTRKLLRERIEQFTTALDRAGADYTKPEGGFYVMARFPGFPGTFENVEQLIDEAGVAGMPGEAFGDARADWFRFALVTSRVEAAVERLAAFFE